MVIAVWRYRGADFFRNVTRRSGVLLPYDRPSDLAGKALYTPGNKTMSHKSLRQPGKCHLDGKAKQPEWLGTMGKLCHAACEAAASLRRFHDS